MKEETKVPPGYLHLEIYEDGTTMCDIKCAFPSPQQAGVTVSRVISTLAQAFANANPDKSKQLAIEGLLEGVRYGLKYHSEDAIELQ